MSPSSPAARALAGLVAIAAVVPARAQEPPAPPPVESAPSPGPQPALLVPAPEPAAIAPAPLPPQPEELEAAHVWLVVDSIDYIGVRLRETLALRTRAVHEGAAIKTSCIDQKLRAIRDVLAEATAMRDRWSQPDAISLRAPWLARSKTLRGVADASLEAARACTDARPAQGQLAVVVPGPLPVPTLADPVRPPTVDRPPLASPY